MPEPGIVAPEEDHAATTEYARLHPMAFRFLVRAFGFGCTLDGTEQQQQWRRRFAGPLRLGAFRSGDNDE